MAGDGMCQPWGAHGSSTFSSMADTRADGQERTTHRRPETGWPTIAGGELGIVARGCGAFRPPLPVSCLIFRITDLGSASINLYLYIMYLERYIFCSPVTSLFRISLSMIYLKGRWFFVFATSSFRRWPDFKSCLTAGSCRGEGKHLESQGPTFLLGLEGFS